ncbi:MAG: hypothetical protein ABIA47_01235 [bacterium]
MTTRFVGVKEFRQNMSKLANRARRKNERLIILRKNEPIFELRPIGKGDAQMGKFLSNIQEALDDVQAGRLYTHEQIKETFGIS